MEPTSHKDNKMTEIIGNYTKQTLKNAKNISDKFISLIEGSAKCAKDIINQENINIIIHDIYFNGNRLHDSAQANVRMNIRLADTLLTRFVHAVLKQTYRDARLQGTNTSRWSVPYCGSWFEDNVFEGPIRGQYILVELLWKLLQNSATQTDLSEDEKRIKSWNTRVDEQRLIQKLGSSGNWFKEEDKMKNNFVECHLTIQPDEKETWENRKEEDEIDLTEESVCESKLKTQPKKKYSLLRPLTKFFKGGKQNKSKESVERPKEKLNNTTMYRCKNELTTSNTLTQRKPVSLESGDSLTNNLERDSLTIHIPGNITRIVLIKDGRKIAVEI